MWGASKRPTGLHEGKHTVSRVTLLILKRVQESNYAFFVDTKPSSVRAWFEEEVMQLDSSSKFLGRYTEVLSAIAGVKGLAPT